MPNANLVAAQNQLRNLVSIYNSNFDQYQQATYNETQVRVDFVNPFFQLLGWDVLNEAGLPQHLREVTHEATVLVEENGAHRSKKPDYSFKVGTEILFFLETKKPSVNITADRAPSFQLRRYGWSGNLKVSVLTNFTDLFIYDCTVRPVEGDEIVKASLPKISSQCIRVPVLNGHTAAVFVKFNKKPTKEQLIEKLVNYSGVPQELKLPSAPKQFIQYMEEDNRPQVKLDVDYENGMGISIGRLREDTIYDYKFVGLSHNTVRGAAGGAVLCAELLKAKGFINKK